MIYKNLKVGLTAVIKVRKQVGNAFFHSYTLKLQCILYMYNLTYYDHQCAITSSTLL